MRGAHTAFVAALVATGCVGGTMVHEGKHWRRVPATASGQASADSHRRIDEGDTVKVVTKENKVHLFRVYEIHDDGFTGTAKNRRDYRIRYDKIQSMYVWRDGTYLDLPFGTVSGN